MFAGWILVALLCAAFATSQLSSQSKICVYGIAKNEEVNIDRFMSWAKHADHVLILDTGSTDNTIADFKKWGAEVEEARIQPWRFDLARNLAFKALLKSQPKCEIFVTADLDDVMWPENEWRPKVESIWNAQPVSRICFPWFWNATHKPNESNFDKCWVHSRDYEWIYPVHEKLVPLPGLLETTVVSNDISLREYPEEKDRNYTDLLILSVKEYPESAAHHLWLGVSLYWETVHQEERAIKEFSRYLSSPRDNRGIDWIHKKHIRSYAYRMIANLYGKLGQPEKQYNFLLWAIAEDSTQRDGWVTLASYYLHHKKWWECVGAAERALTIPKSEWIYEWPLIPCVWNECPEQLLSACYWPIGTEYFQTLGCRAAKRAYALNPQSEISITNYLGCQEAGFDFETEQFSSNEADQNDKNDHHPHHQKTENQ